MKSELSEEASDERLVARMEDRDALQKKERGSTAWAIENCQSLG